MAKISAQSDTITAISTPPGAGGIGIVRVSGRDALGLLKKIFRPHSPTCTYSSHRMYYGHIVNPSDARTVDEVLAVFMQAPNSYTCEDVVEIHCHGSYLILQQVIEILVAEGARIAESGEFTKRAFLNGRIDLTKAEAVIDILSAKTKKGVELAQEQLAGVLYDRVDVIRKSLVKTKAEVEVAIDFPDEDIELINVREIAQRIHDEVYSPLLMLIDASDQGRVIREGISVVIVGQPNVGKSSLLNTLLQEERALVTEVPGTTRDSIEEILDIKGMPVKIIDTAGIRENADIVESLGIKRALELIDKADLVLFVIDGAKGVAESDKRLYATVAHKEVILVMNKSDIAGETVLPEMMSSLRSVSVSAKMQTGMDELKDAVFQSVTGGDLRWQEENCAPNLRHKNALLRAKEACQVLADGLSLGNTADLIAVDIQECLDHLGDIIGETTTEDVLDVIFEQFCLGK